mmetsp:Transcript_46754/g.54047  ORF Transcript_46754/g.54047 Transcript_46754/m.54047 type:complete len:426 (-) Transcript_46754:389-1666(-)
MAFSTKSFPVTGSTVKNLSRLSKNNDSARITITNKKTNGKRKSASLPSETVEYLKAWMMSPEHIAHPYPTEQEKVEIMKDTGIELKQLTNWFVNNRKRYWKPRVEARLQQQTQAQAHAAAVVAVSIADDTVSGGQQGISLEDAVTMTTSAVETATSTPNLVSPILNFKSIKSALTMRGNNSLLTFDDTRKDRDIVDTSTTSTTSLLSPSSPLQQELFASPLTFAAQMLDQKRRKHIPSTLTSTTTAFHVLAEREDSSSVASISASEDEMSDSGIDDASSSSSDDSAFVNNKFGKKKNCITSSTLYPEDTTRTTYTRSVSICSLEHFSGKNFAPQGIKVDSGPVISTPPSSSSSSFINRSNKRKVVVDKDEFPVVSAVTGTNISSRKRFRTVSIDIWIDACRNASHVNDECLPSLEEASRLFGYTN